MATTIASFTFHFPPEFDDRAEYEMSRKGYLDGGEVELENGVRYPLFFYDPVRLSQELEAETLAGRPVIAEPAMVVVPEVTRAHILQAIEELVRTRFFDHLKPLVRPTSNVVEEL